MMRVRVQCGTMAVRVQDIQYVGMYSMYPVHACVPMYMYIVSEGSHTTKSVAPGLGKYLPQSKICPSNQITEYLIDKNVIFFHVPTMHTVHNRFSFLCVCVCVYVCVCVSV